MRTNIRLQSNGQWLISFRGLVLGQRPNLTQSLDLLLSWLRENIKQDVVLAIETIEGQIDHYRYEHTKRQVRLNSAQAA
jgi:hypothetical protein